MKGKHLFFLALALFVCFNLVFTASAQALTPQETIINQIKDFDWGYDSGFYNKVSGSANFKVNRLAGSLLKGLDGLDLNGSTFKYDTKVDTPNQKAALDFELEYKGKTYQGQIFLDKDCIILGPDILEMVQELAPETKDMDFSRFPQYIYLQDKQLAGIWKSLMQYRDQQMPAEFKDLMLFVFEAVPGKYFTVSPGKITLQLDQDGFEDVVYNLIEKVKNERDRFAGILVGMATLSDPTGAMGSPEKMRKELISDIEKSMADGSFPSREQIHGMAKFIQVKDFRYEISMMPGGPKQFKAVFDLQEASGIAGQIEINSNATGGKGNLKGGYNFKVDLTSPDKKTRINGSIACDFVVQGGKADSRVAVTAGARNVATGEVMLDLSLAGESSEKVDPGVKIDIPELTASNSLNISELNKPSTHNTITILINGKPLRTSTALYLDGGRTMVPLRDVATALNCRVEWLEPNEVRITRGDKVVAVRIGEVGYTVNGETKEMDVVPIIRDGRTFVPVRFVATGLGFEVNPVGDFHVIAISGN